MAVRKLTSGNKKWRADWTANGIRKRRDFDTKREAEEFHAKTIQSLRRGTYIDPKLATKTTVGQFYPQWIERIQTVGANGRKPASPKTLDNYRRQYHNYVAPRWGHTPLTNVTYDDVADWIATLKQPAPLPPGARYDAMPREVGTVPAGATTRREVGLMFGRLLGYAVKRRLLAANPAKDPLGQTDYVPEKSKLRDHVYLEFPQLARLARSAGDYDLFVMLAGTCGLRWGEISALQVEDVTLGPKPSVAVVRAYSEISGRLVLGPTKGGEDRVVPLPRLVADRLAAVIDGKLDGARIFSGARGQALRNNTWSKRFYAPAIAAATMEDPDFPRPTFHDLRHTAVSLAISQGANVKVVQRIAGHASATITLDTYAGLFDNDLHDSAGRINDALTGLDWK